MASPVFSGNSRFSRDFQSIVERSVAIAELPQRQLENQRVRFDAQSKAVDSISTQVRNFRTSLEGLKRSLTANPNTVAAIPPGIADLSATATASVANYSLNVISLGSNSSAWSRTDLPRVTNPRLEGLTSETNLTLRINGADTPIVAAGTDLNSLAEAINAQTETTSVKASIVNVGNPSSADYRLVLQSTKLGPETIELMDSSSTLSAAVTTGSPAQYQLAGLPVTIESFSRTVELAPGLSATLKQTGSTTVSVTAASTISFKISILFSMN
jgi:flagellar hook-associated protein 2